MHQAIRHSKPSNPPCPPHSFLPTAASLLKLQAIQEHPLPSYRQFLSIGFPWSPPPEKWIFQWSSIILKCFILNLILSYPKFFLIFFLKICFSSLDRYKFEDEINFYEGGNEGFEGLVILWGYYHPESRQRKLYSYSWQKWLP